MRFTSLAIMLHHGHFASFLFILLVLYQLLIPAPAEAASTFPRYSIVLAAAPGENLHWEPSKNHLFNDYTFFVEKTTIKAEPWERLCLGFFSPRKEATSILKKVQQIYPGAWINKVSTKNILTTIHSPTGPIATASTLSAAKLKRKKAVTEGTSSLTDKQLNSLMQRAKSDFKNKKYSSSIRYLNALIAAGEHKYSQQALEYLGMARQRKGQKTHAVVAYKEYLKRYPDSDGAGRVSQRLAALLTETSAARKKIRMTTREPGELITHGSFSQFYQNNRTAIDGIGKQTTLSQLITFMDLNTQYQSTKFDHRFQFTSDHTYDFINNDFIDRSDKSEFRFIETYYELGYRKTGSSGRLGRQRLQVGGTLKRFDGVTLGYQFNPDLRLNVLAGFPVDFNNKTSINKHKTFYGFTFETGTFLNRWSMNLFYFDQTDDGIHDSNNIGTNLHYDDQNKSLFGLIDYDLLFDKINILQLIGNINFAHGRNAYVNLFLHQSPLISTSNALIGRQEKSLKELKKVLNIEQIRQLARDRTADNETVTIGGSQQINKKYQINTDITFIHIGKTTASGGVPATADTGTDYYLNTQLIGNSMLMKNDTNILGLRYYNTDLSDMVSFIANSRFPVTRNWRINPRLQYDIRQLKDGQSRNRLHAVFRTDYRYLYNVQFDFEIGYDKNSGKDVAQLLGDNSLFFTLGYRWDF